MKNLKLLTLTILAITFITTITSCGGNDSPNLEPQTDVFKVEVNNETIQEGSTWTTSEVGDLGNMPLVITNLTNENIYLKIIVTSLSDNVATANEIELCMGECYYGISVNNSYPSTTPLVLMANATTPENAVHVKNNNNRDGDISIGLKIYQTNELGNELSNGQNLSFTYFYDAP